MSKAQILDVAEQLFGTYGYQGASLEQVASGSEFSVGAVYKFYPSKRDLLAAVMSRRFDEMRTRIDHIRALDLPGLDELLTLCAYYLEYFREHPAFGRLTLRVYPGGLEQVPDFAEYSADIQQGTQLLVQALGRGQREGTVRAADTTWLATLLLGLIMFDHSMRSEQSVHSVPAETLLELIRSAVARPGASLVRGA
jgi:AcrR family transcriptional regulator